MLSETLGMAKSVRPKNAEFTLTGRFFAAEKSDKEENPRHEDCTQLSAIGLLIVIYIIFADGND